MLNRVPDQRLAGGTERGLDLDGFGGEKPVRVGNQAFEHVQNDVYGEMVLAISRLFLDQRFVGSVPPRTAIETVEGSSRRSRHGSGAGRRPWEFRERTRPAHLYGAHALGRRAAGGRGRGRARRRGSRHALGTWRRERPRSSASSTGTTSGRADAGRGRGAAGRGEPAGRSRGVLRAGRPAGELARGRDPRRPRGRRRPRPAAPLCVPRRLRAHGGRVHGVRSGSWKRWRSSGGRTSASSSSACCRSRTGSACTRRILRTPSSRPATSPRPTPTSG